jgi:hypothetical protein
VQGVRFGVLKSVPFGLQQVAGAEGAPALAALPLTAVRLCVVFCELRRRRGQPLF